MGKISSRIVFVSSVQWRERPTLTLSCLIRIEHDLHGRQINAYKIIRNLNRTGKDNLRLNPTVEHTWLDHCQKLWTKQFNDNTTEGKRAKLTGNCVDLIKMEELETTIKTLKARKSPGSDGINNELYKHAPKSFFYINFLISQMFAGFTETFLKNRGQPLLYQYTKKETEITQITIEVLIY